MSCRRRPSSRRSFDPSRLLDAPVSRPRERGGAPTQPSICRPMRNRSLGQKAAVLFIATLMGASACGARQMASTSARPSSVTCNLYASVPAGHHRSRRRGRGSLRHPFSSAQRLVNALRPAETGCLLGGTYDVAPELRFNHGGSSGKPITLTSAPGQRAVLEGGPLYIPAGSNFVTLSHLHVNTHRVHAEEIQIMSAYDKVLDSNITNHNSQASCIILGYSQAATHTLIEGNVIHGCGHNPADPYEDHGVYVDWARHAKIVNNIFWGIPDGWAVQLYPDASDTQVLHNVMDDNGQGVVFAGDGSSASSENTVAYNIITSTARGYDVDSSWEGPVGSGNVAKDNCLYGRGSRGIERPTKGFAAQGNRFVNPRYRAPAKHDYALMPGSPCLRVVGYDIAAQLARH